MGCQGDKPDVVWHKHSADGCCIIIEDWRDTWLKNYVMYIANLKRELGSQRNPGKYWIGSTLSLLAKLMEVFPSD
jgi:hypothetical protein